MRIDKLLVQKGLALSRERAKNLIIEGKVWVDGKQVMKSTTDVEEESAIELRGEDSIRWVSRGGLKLQKALDEFKPDVKDKVCLDIGACTGGFTDVLLSYGAKKVYALDVGHDQLAEKLKNDPRVVNIEGINIREVTKDTFKEPIEFMAIDVSFISLEHVLPIASALLGVSGEIVALIKPHFEVGKKQIKKGFVKDPALHEKVIEKIRIIAQTVGLDEIGLTEAPLDEKRNKEFLIFLRKEDGLRRI